MLRLGAALCFLAVAFGAFGAHALKARLELHQTREIWNTAVLYHFLHAVVIVFLAYVDAHRLIAALFASGILLFSGSLYLLALTGSRWLGAITPLGGLCFLMGWAWLFFSGRR